MKLLPQYTRERLSWLAIGLWFLASPHPPALAGEASLWGRRVASVDITCDAIFERKPVNRALMTEPGTSLSREAVQQSIQLIYDHGLYKNVEALGEILPDGNVALTYRLTKKTIVRSLNINGGYLFAPFWPFKRAGVPKQAIRKALLVNRDQEFTDDRLKESILALQDLFHKYGWYRCKVIPEIEEDPERKLVNLTLNIHPGEPTRVRNITINGEHTFESDTMYSHLSNKVGRRFKGLKAKEDEEDLQKYLQGDRGLVLKAFRRLFNLHRKFRMAAVDYEGEEYLSETNQVDLKYQIEGGTRVAVKFIKPFHWWQVWRRIAHGSLYNELPTVEECDGDEYLVQQGVDNLTVLYKEKGYYDPVITYVRLPQPQKNELKINYSILAEPSYKVTTFTFKGHETYDDKKLRKQMLTGKLFHKTLVQETLETDLQAIVGMYYDLGFPRAEAELEDIILNKEEMTAEVVISIKEGTRFWVSGVEIPGLPELEKRPKLTVKKGHYFKQVEVDADVTTLLTACQAAGYKDAQIEPAYEWKEAENKVVVSFNVTPGPLATFGKLVIRGYSLTQRKIIFREVTFEEGEPYNLEKIFKTQRRLYDLGIFQTVGFQPATTAPRPVSIMDTILNVQERNSGLVEFGFGYDREERIRGSFIISHRNLAGFNRRLSLSLAGSAIHNRQEIGFGEPWLFNNPYNFDMAVFRDEEQKPDFLIKNLGTALKVTKKITEEFKVIGEYRLESVSYLPELAVPDAVSELFSSVVLSTYWDRRNNPFNPTKGTYTGVSLEVARKEIGSDRNFTKFLNEFSWYTPWKRNVIALGIRYGLGDNLPIQRKFDVGGRSTLRGFQRNDIGPYTLDPVSGEIKFVGGDAMTVANAELRVPLFGSIWGATFYDTGFAWGHVREWNVRDFRQDAGLGLIWVTPIGPVRIDYGWKLDRREGENAGEYFISFGHAF